jgi:hypothetical protein
LQEKFHFHFIDADGSPAEVEERIQRELRYVTVGLGAGFFRFRRGSRSEHTDTRVKWSLPTRPLSESNRFRLQVRLSSTRE